MAHSPFMLAGDGVDVRDDFLWSIVKRLRQYADQTGTVAWLQLAADGWLKTCDDRAPGCMAFYLDDWLTSDQRRVELLAALNWVKRDLLHAASVGDADISMVPFEETFERLNQLIAPSGR